MRASTVAPRAQRSTAKAVRWAVIGRSGRASGSGAQGAGSARRDACATGARWVGAALGPVPGSGARRLRAGVAFAHSRGAGQRGLGRGSRRGRCVRKRPVSARAAPGREALAAVGRRAERADGIGTDARRLVARQRPAHSRVGTSEGRRAMQDSVGRGGMRHARLPVRVRCLEREGGHRPARGRSAGSNARGSASPHAAAPGCADGPAQGGRVLRPRAPAGGR